MDLKKIIILASGEGSNFSAIVESGIKVHKVITNNPNANVIKRAKEAGISSCLIVPDKQRKAFPVNIYRKEYDKKVDYMIGGRGPNDVDLIVLAGWMRIFSPWFCEKWAGKIINIHPSLLPAFGGGCHAIRDAWEYGCKVFGVTVHWVIPEVDEGTIIIQRAINKFDDDTLEEITKKIHKIEHYVYPKTIKKLMRI